MEKSGRIIRMIVWFFMGGFMLFNLFGCGETKYHVTADAGFKLKKTEYAAGDRVEAVYGQAATDTSYRFYADSPDVLVDDNYQDGKGRVASFTMPEHDVKLLADSSNYMLEEDEEADIAALYENAKLIFNYYEASTAIESGGSRTEYAIYDYGSRDRYIFAKYGEETELCWTSNLLYHQCLELVEKYDMRHWENETSLDGGLYVVRIAYGQELLRISSESMAKNGEEAFTAIAQCVAKAWSKDREKMPDGKAVCVTEK